MLSFPVAVVLVLPVLTIVLVTVSLIVAVPVSLVVLIIPVSLIIIVPVTILVHKISPFNILYCYYSLKFKYNIPAERIIILKRTKLIAGQKIILLSVHY